MNKTEQKAFDRLIKEAAHKNVVDLSKISFDITQNVFLELCKAVRDEINNTIENIENYRKE